MVAARLTTTVIMEPCGVKEMMQPLSIYLHAISLVAARTGHQAVVERVEELPVLLLFERDEAAIKEMACRQVAGRL